MVGTTYESSMSESKGDLSRIFVLNLLPETKYKDIVDYSWTGVVGSAATLLPDALFAFKLI